MAYPELTKIFSLVPKLFLNSCMRTYNKKKDPPAPIPEYICLPSGQQISVASIAGRVTERKSHVRRLGKMTQAAKNLKVRVPQGLITGQTHANQQYTMADREWQAEADIEELVKRYGITQGSARVMRHTARSLVAVFRGINTTKSADTEESVIIDHTTGRVKNG